MGKNVGTIDRGLRFVVGAALIVLFFVGAVAAPWNYLAIIAGLVLVGTGLVGFCPAYRLIGMRTCPIDAKS